jgi:hypothetical protein
MAVCRLYGLTKRVDAKAYAIDCFYSVFSVGPVVINPARKYPGM